MSYRKFYLPFEYFIVTRAKGGRKFFAWLLMQFFALLYLAGSFPSATTHLYDWAIGLVLSTIIYELGYIYNDGILAQNEANPTKRLSDLEMRYVSDRFAIIFLCRIVPAGLVAILISFRLFILLSLLGLLFTAYNSVRGRINLPLHFLLNGLRFVTPVYFLEDWWISLFLHPVINFIERCSEEKFGFKLNFLRSRIPELRVVYYGLLCVVSFFLVQNVNSWVIALMFILRGFEYMISSKGTR